MRDEESGRPERPELLLIVVIVANIRPREKSADRRVGGTANGTSLAFIDLCLNEIEIAAPGAIVVRFADVSLLNALPKKDRAELIRRSDLDYTDSDKIFLVQYADRPVLASAHFFEASIVSSDRFEDPGLEELKTSDVRHFRHHYDRSTRSFAFPSMDGTRSLDRWWQLQFGDVPESWFVSDDYVEIEWQLRSGVYEETFQYHSERLTHRPKIPVSSAPSSREITEDWGASEKPVRSGPEGVSHNSKTNEPLDFSHLQVVYLDDFGSLAHRDGQKVQVVGRLVVAPDAPARITWFRGGPSAIIVETGVTPGSLPNDSWVCFSCQVRVVGDEIRLETLRGAKLEPIEFRHVLEMRASESKSGKRSTAAGWMLPEFTRSVVQLVRLRDRRRSTSQKRDAPSAPDNNREDARQPRLIPVFVDGRFEYHERLLTLAEQDIALLEAYGALADWKTEKATALAREREQDAEEQSRGRTEFTEEAEPHEGVAKARKKLTEMRNARLSENREEKRRELQEQLAVANADRTRRVIMLVAAAIFLIAIVVAVVAGVAILVPDSANDARQVSNALDSSTGRLK